eukprot:scpid101859/ scgid14523/ 
MLSCLFLIFLLPAGGFIFAVQTNIRVMIVTSGFTLGLHCGLASLQALLFFLEQIPTFFMTTSTKSKCNKQTCFSSKHTVAGHCHVFDSTNVASNETTALEHNLKN